MAIFKLKTCATPGCTNEFYPNCSDHIYCKPSCQRSHGETKGRKGPPLAERTCEICDGTYMSRAPRSRFCKERCEAPDDRKMICSRCKEPKHWEEFYDYRDGIEGKRHSACMDCERKRSLESIKKRGRK